MSKDFGDNTEGSVDTDPFLFYTYNMRQLLLLLLSLFTFNLFGQGYVTTKIQTNSASTAKMIWNYTSNEWDFVDNHDLMSFTSVWTFNVNSQNKGLITNSTVNYDILEYKYVDDETVYFRVYNLKVGREMEMVLIKKSGVFNIAVFDKIQRNAFYFFP